MINRILTLMLFALVAACSKPSTPPPLPDNPGRIVSMAPSITECVFAAGGGARLVGVTDFCTYPDTARSLPRVGGYTDINYEMIYSLKPDLVLLFAEHQSATERLSTLGIPTLQLDTSTIPAILETLGTLGSLFHTEATTGKEIARLQQRMNSIRERTRNAPPRRVLISVGRNIGSGELSDVYVAGRNTLYNEMLELIGAQNVYTGNLEYAKLSREGLMRLAPDVIIDLVPDLESIYHLTPQDVRKDWNLLAGIPAVKNEQVHVLGNDYVCIPGPRFILAFEDIAHAVYPEVSQDDQ